MEQKEKDELLSRRFTENDRSDTTIFIDYSVQHQQSLKVGIRSLMRVTVEWWWRKFSNVIFYSFLFFVYVSVGKPRS